MSQSLRKSGRLFLAPGMNEIKVTAKDVAIPS